MILLLLLLFFFKENKSDLNNSNYSSKVTRGREGEMKVKRILNSLTCPYYLINDVNLIINDRSTQIDHILIKQDGVYVIETKNWVGEISGDFIYHDWIQNVNGNKYLRYNPILQNETHIKNLKNLLNEDLPYKNIVCMVNEKGRLNVKEDEVYSISSLKRRIEENEKPIISLEKMENLYKKIKKLCY